MSRTEQTVRIWPDAVVQTGDAVAWCVCLPDGRVELDMLFTDIDEAVGYIETRAIPGCTLRPLSFTRKTDPSIVDERAVENKERAKWTTGQWYEHVGAWETPEGYISFGSPMAVAAMRTLFQRVHQVTVDDAARYRYLSTLRDWHDIERACWSTPAESAAEFKRGLDKYIDAQLTGETK